MYFSSAYEFIVCSVGHCWTLGQFRCSSRLNVFLRHPFGHFQSREHSVLKRTQCGPIHPLSSFPKPISYSLFQFSVKYARTTCRHNNWILSSVKGSQTIDVAAVKELGKSCIRHLTERQKLWREEDEPQAFRRRNVGATGLKEVTDSEFGFPTPRTLARMPARLPTL